MDKATIFLRLLSTLLCMTPLLKAKESYEGLSSNVLHGNHSRVDSSLTENERLATSLPPVSLTVPCRERSERRREEFCKCPSFIALDPDEYVMVNGTAYIANYNESYSPSFYELQGSTLWICMPTVMQPGTGESEKPVVNDKYSRILAYITLIGLCISIICLGLHLIAFVVVKELRNIPGYCMACLCVSLFSGYTSFLVGFDENILHSRGPCVATAFSTHFFLLSSLLWMNAVAFDVLKSLLNATSKLRMISSKRTFKSFYVYCLYSWGIALVFAMTAVIAENVPDFPDKYKPHFYETLCWFQQGEALLVFFAAPLFALICINVVLFGWSAYIITTHRMKQADPQRSIMKRNLIMYSRLAVIMGLSWIFALIAVVSEQIAFWYVFVILNTFQGFLIFLSFTCTPKVKRHFYKMLGIEYTKTSVQTSSRAKSGNVSKETDLKTRESAFGNASKDTDFKTRESVSGNASKETDLKNREPDSGNASKETDLKNRESDSENSSKETDLKNRESDSGNASKENGLKIRESVLGNAFKETDLKSRESVSGNTSKETDLKTIETV